MNFKKVALLILLSTISFPAITSAKTSKDNPVMYPVKHASVGKSIIRLLTLGHKG